MTWNESTVAAEYDRPLHCRHRLASCLGFEERPLTHFSHDVAGIDQEPRLLDCVALIDYWTFFLTYYTACIHYTITELY